ncbi:hypothetical protein COLO4_37797 [Corchorus olitorius]|uniref:Uncharacterized protein n=1 Tax=Corchorus olitorius TaxID=93759 RepID=A0A1R3FZD1_9ROSI|nr:hypothetical protein COLO4_37797 [Corchorus olitorius]
MQNQAGPSGTKSIDVGCCNPEVVGLPNETILSPNVLDDPTEIAAVESANTENLGIESESCKTPAETPIPIDNGVRAFPDNLLRGGEGSDANDQGNLGTHLSQILDERQQTLEVEDDHSADGIANGDNGGHYSSEGDEGNGPAGSNTVEDEIQLGTPNGGVQEIEESSQNGSHRTRKHG